MTVGRGGQRVREINRAAPSPMRLRAIARGWDAAPRGKTR